MKFTWYSPAGIQIEMSKDSDTYRLLLGYDGLSKILCTHITTQAPYQDGVDLIDTHFEPREITIPILVTAPDLENLQIAVRNLTISLNPLAGPGTLVFTSEDGSEYSLTCIGNNTPTISTDTRTGTSQTVTLNLIGHNPFWYSYPSQITYFGAGTPVVFPYTFPWMFPSSTPTQTITNSGDIPSEVVITITGAITNPTISRSYTDRYGTVTTESMAFTITMVDGDVLTVTTAFGNKNITYWHNGAYDTNPFQYLDTGSVFWSLVPGNNSVSVTESAISAGTTTGIEHFSKYSGI